MKKKPTITLCVMTYNRSTEIGATIKSYISQEFKNSELVIIDNHSTDNTAQVVSEWLKKDKRIKYFRNKENIGVTRNFYNSFKHCRGSYVVFLGDDDLFIEKSALKEYVTVFKKNKDIGAVRSRQVLFKESKVFQVAGITNSGKDEIYKKGRESFFRFLTGSSSLAGIAYLNNSRLKDLILIQETMYPQIDLAARMSLFYNTAQINKYLIGVGRGSNQLSALSYMLYGKKTNMVEDLSMVYDNIYKNYGKFLSKAMNKNIFMKMMTGFIPIFLPYNTWKNGHKDTLLIIKSMLYYNNQIIFSPLFICSMIIVSSPKILIQPVLSIINKLKLSALLNSTEINKTNLVIGNLLNNNKSYK